MLETMIAIKDSVLIKIDGFFFGHIFRVESTRLSCIFAQLIKSIIAVWINIIHPWL